MRFEIRDGVGVSSKVKIRGGVRLWEKIEAGNWRGSAAASDWLGDMNAPL